MGQPDWLVKKREWMMAALESARHVQAGERVVLGGRADVLVNEDGAEVPGRMLLLSEELYQKLLGVLGLVFSVADTDADMHRAAGGFLED